MSNLSSPNQTSFPARLVGSAIAHAAEMAHGPGRRECDCRMVPTPHHSPSRGRACSACPGKTTDLSDRSEWVGPGQQGKGRANIGGDSEAGHLGRIGSLADKRTPPRHDWLVGGNRSKGLAPREKFAPRRVRGSVGSAGSPLPPAQARRAHRRRDWPRDKAARETARRAVRSCALFATAP